MRIALLLIALGFGFKIFAEASTNAKKSVKRLGRLIGVFIMLVSFLGTLCIIRYTVQYGKGGSLCPFSGKMWGLGSKMCPIMGQPVNSNTAADSKK